MVAFQNQLFVLGGKAKVCVKYKPESDTWTILQGPALLHHYGAAVVLKGKIMILGGSNSDKVEEYDVKKDEWKLSDMKLPIGMQQSHVFTM
jgi:N-acetylneuraminic acid mutarotase